MNTVLPAKWDERIHRLALGIEPVDAARGGRTGLPVRVTMDRAPARVARDPSASPWEARDGRERIARNDSCRHRLLLRPGLESPLDLRITDPAKRFVPRRLSVEILGPGSPPDSPPASPPEPRLAGRVIRPALFPGAAYPVPAGVVGCRGRVVTGPDATPLRWARVVAERGDGTVVGRAQGDENGEFLLLLGSAVVVGAELPLPLVATVTVLGPGVPPAPAPGDPADDPLWDLPLEAADDSDAGAAVLAGETEPDGYVAGSVRVVEFGLDGLGSEEFDFS
jgi:hypothetical protein